MKAIQIYHVSEKRSLPLIFDTRGPLKIEVLEADLSDLERLTQAAGPDRLFLIQAKEETLRPVVKALKGQRSLIEHPFVFILPEQDYKSMRSQLTLLGKILVLVDTIRPEHLRVIVELLLEREHFHKMLKDLSTEGRKQSHAFGQVLELARKELEAAQKESSALKALLDYEGDLKKAHQEIEKAMEKANRLKEQELISLKEQLQVVEKLNEYREQELKETREIAKATEQALEFSIKENIERDRILVAMDKLRGLSDQELLELYEENRDLRKRLGLPPRDESAS